MIKDLIIQTRQRSRRLQDKLYTGLLDYVIDNIKVDGDTIKFTNSNLNVISQLDKKISKGLSKELDSLKKYVLSGVSKMIENNISEYGQTDIRAIEIGGKVQKNIMNHAKKNIDQLTDITPIYEQVKKQAIALMSKYDGVSLRELREKISISIREKQAVEKYFSRWTYDLYSQYQRVGANEIRKGLGLVFAVYEGGEIETTREFCEARNGKVFHISEIENWSSLEWQGKPDTGYNPIIDLGGYNCRHVLRWVSKEFAALKRPEVKELFPYEFNQKRPEPDPIEPKPAPVEPPKINLGFDKQFDDFVNRETVPDLIKNVINILPKPQEIKTKGRFKGSYYIPSTKTLVVREGKGMDNTFYHEYGHHVDLGTGGTDRSLNPKLMEAVNKDVAELNKKYPGNFLSEMAKRIDNRDKYGISDIIDGIAGGRFFDKYFKPGHGAKYYRRPGAQRKEIYANVFEIISSNNKEANELLEELFPNTKQFIIDDLNEILNQ